MTVIMRMWSPPQLEGQYLMSFHFDTADGKGFGTFTHDQTKAKRFQSPAEAMLFWRTQSKVRPTRPDGEPNRPLTVSSVELLRLEDTMSLREHEEKT
jgi:hypothetical protein